MNSTTPPRALPSNASPEAAVAEAIKAGRAKYFTIIPSEDTEGFRLSVCYEQSGREHLYESRPINGESSKEVCAKADKILLRMGATIEQIRALCVK